MEKNDVDVLVKFISTRVGSNILIKIPMIETQIKQTLQLYKELQDIIAILGLDELSMVNYVQETAKMMYLRIS